jgi:hypothetical protein
MKKLLIGLLALGSISAYASEQIELPTLNGKLFAKNSNEHGICRALGFNGAIQGTKSVSKPYSLSDHTVEVNKRGEVVNFWEKPLRRYVESVKCAQ